MISKSDIFVSVSVADDVTLAFPPSVGVNAVLPSGDSKWTFHESDDFFAVTVPLINKVALYAAYAIDKPITEITNANIT